MDKIGINTIDEVILVGAFGSYIDTKYAMVLGMIPDCNLQRVHSAGNAAGTGARIALLNKHSRKEIENTVKRIEKIETAVEPMSVAFQTSSFPGCWKWTVVFDSTATQCVPLSAETQ